MKQATNFDWIRQMILDLPFDKVEERMKNNSNLQLLGLRLERNLEKSENWKSEMSAFPITHWRHLKLP